MALCSKHFMLKNMWSNMLFHGFRRWYSQYTTSKNCKLGILGIPCESGQDKLGPGQGPAAFRKAGLVNKLKTFGNIDVKDYGDVNISSVQHVSNITNCKQFESCIQTAKATSKTILDILSEGKVCCTLGGDHFIALGTVHGHMLAFNNVALLWIDAHADININTTSNSGNMHGMPVSLLTTETRKYWPKLPALEWLQKSIPAKNLAYIGLRSVDIYERLIIDKLGITAFGISDVEKYGIDTVVTMALNQINPRGERSLHVSFDIDSLEPMEAPSTGTPVRGGLSLREGIHIMETVNEHGCLRVLDVVEVNPLIGKKEDVERTVEAAIEIIKAAFIGKREGVRDETILKIPTV
ncbi:arginase-1 isoform X1 [Atheta coriaria]|uniref:arginase-1 isoform X1 n=1 Tax=Dalotia coriaria TaxID=877792 RepID=UPI0031F3C5AA